MDVRVHLAEDRVSFLREIADGEASAVVTATADVSADAWAQVGRVLRPGAHAFVFGRYDVSLALRRIGFEIRDSLFIASGARNGVYFATLARKPLSEPTVASQALATETGPINIGASRIRHSNAADFERHKAGVEAVKARGGVRNNSWKNSSDLSGANDVTVAGRWPSNMLFVHTPKCRRTGSARIAAPVINRFDDGMKPFGGGAGHSYASLQTGDSDGMETVETWTCVESCPIGALNAQSGPSNQHEGAGGASRFFKTFAGADVTGALPVELLSYVVQMVCPPGGLLLDPFCGFGDVCLAARAVGARCLGVVTDPTVYDVARRAVEGS